LIRLIKKIVGWLIYFFILTLLFTTGTYFLLYDSHADFKEDIGSLKREIRVLLYDKGYVADLNEVDRRFIYEKNCYRKCHGEAAMITAVLSPAGWFQVVERMRLKENVLVSGREAEVIIKYLEERYPKTKSRFSYEVRKKIHNVVWRHDVGLGDIYCDIIFATKEYLISIGADYLIDEYDLENFYVFIVSVSVHDGVVELFDLDRVSFLRNASHVAPTAPPWQLRFQTADKHHFEALIRFEKSNPLISESSDSKWFEINIKEVGGVANRAFRWELPLRYPVEISAITGSGSREK
tara:strand:+ start:21853 stop:22734 length:882 start_codon:yes stop_codon:yes gene_type:complete